MSERLTSVASWNRARALKLHEHFKAAALAVKSGGKIGRELKRMHKLVNGLMLSDGLGGQWLLTIGESSLRREWDYWHAGGREDHASPDHVCKPEALLCNYKAGCNGNDKLPRKLIQEFHRRMTLVTGGRDKHKKSPISAVFQSIQKDYEARRPLPGVDYDQVAIGAELPWCYRTFCNHKPSRAVRALGNNGGSAGKGVGAYVNMNYSRLRKCELFTLDDVRLDIVCIDEATGQAIEVVLYIFMEVGSRMIVGYVLKPAAAIKQEDVDELVAHMLQVPGFGLGVGYTTHILFERGATACSEAAQSLLEGLTNGNLKVHRTGMVGGIKWVGGPRDKARGNACGKAVIESFNRWLHYALLHLPGQRGNKFENQPQSLGDMGKGNFFERPKAGKGREYNGTLIDQAEQLAQFEIASGRRCKLKLPMLRLFELNEQVREAIKRHNTEAGHEYRGHGKFFQEETAPGVWTDTDIAAPAARSATAHTIDFSVEVAELADATDTDAATDRVDHRETAGMRVQVPSSTPKVYKLKESGAAPLAPQQRNGIYFGLWKEVESLKLGIDRFALTSRTLGCVPKVAEMTDAQFRKITSVFAAIVRDANPPTLPNL